MSHPVFLRRTELMLGTPMLDTLKATKVAIIGLALAGLVLQDLEAKATSAT